MLEVATAQVLLSSGHLAVSLVRPDGTVLFENSLARQMLGREAAPSKSVRDSLTTPSEWEELVSKTERTGTLEDEPLLLQTPHGNAELYYITVVPQFSAAGTLERLLCVWAARRNEAPRPAATESDSLTDYTRDLEEVLEHRTYQNLLAAEQNEFARDALDILSVGILVVSRDGEIIYRNQAMSDAFGLRPGDYIQLDVHHVLAPELADAFAAVVVSGTRRFIQSADPGGLPAAVHLQPLLRMNSVQKVVLEFSRPTESGGTA